jgi:IS30 family transposase
MKKQLTIEQKLSIALSRAKSLRALALEYGVHHSTIADIFKESAALLQDYWTEKSQRQGRPANAVAVAMEASEPEQAALEKQLALKQMRIDFLELKLQWEHDRARDEPRTARKQLKKKRN